MKKLSLIVLVALIAAVTSCQKEVITPANSTTSDRPTWEYDITTNTDKDSGSDVHDKALDDEDDETDISTGDLTGEGGITDPNKDPDASKRKGSKGKK